MHGLTNLKNKYCANAGTYAQRGQKHRILLLDNSLQSEHHCTWLICIFLDETAVQF